MQALGIAGVATRAEETGRRFVASGRLASTVVGFTGTDESSLVERLEQVEVSVVQGSDRNLKITKPTDMDLARLFLAEELAGRTAS